MAKKSLIIKNEQRRELAERHRESRLELKHIISSPATSASEREDAVRTLARMPRDTSPSRVRNRDVIDGRPRAYSRAFGLSRVNLRRLAHAGELPGVVKSSW